MEIKQGNSTFYVGDSEENPMAEITFQQQTDGHIVVDHTYVSDQLRGQGIAGLLVEKVIEYARTEGIKIIPECSYAKRYLEKNNITDVLRK